MNDLKNQTISAKNRVNEAVIILVLLICYTYFFPRWADPNQNSRLDMVVSIVDDNTFAIDKYVVNTVDYAHYGAHYYSDKPPGAAFLGIPIYAGLKVLFNTPFVANLIDRLANNQAFQATLKADGSGIYTEKVKFAIAQVVLTFFVSIIPSILLCIFLYRLLLGFEINASLSLAVVLIYGVLTPAFAYAGAFYSHQLSSALLVGAFLLARTKNSFSVFRSVLIGALLAYAVISEYPTITVAGIIFLYTSYILFKSKQWKKIIWVFLLAVVGGVGLMLYNKAVFGNPFSLGYEYSELWTNQHSTGFMSLTIPHWDAFWGMTFGIFRGLFILSPILLLAIPGFIFWWKTKQYRAEFIVSLACVFVMFLFNSSSIMWWGGFSIGPRYLLAAIPFMALAVGFVFQGIYGKIWFKILAVILSIWSFIATWGLTLSGQAFPPDTISNPFLDYAIPNWQTGNIARNFGTILGIPGILSLIPLAVLTGLVFLAWVFVNRTINRGTLRSYHQSIG